MAGRRRGALDAAECRRHFASISASLKRFSIDVFRREFSD